jgi:hypothetical protein
MTKVHKRRNFPFRFELGWGTGFVQVTGKLEKFSIFQGLENWGKARIKS